MFVSKLRVARTTSCLSVIIFTKHIFLFSSLNIFLFVCIYVFLPPGRKPKVKSITVMQSGSSISLTCRVRGGRGQEATSISWRKDGMPLALDASGKEGSLGKGKKWKQADSSRRRMTVRAVRTSKSILTLDEVEEEDAGLYSCSATNPSGTHRRDVKVTIRRRAVASTTTSTTTTTRTTSPPTPTTTAPPAPVAARLRLLPFPPGHVGLCPIPGFCLNSGTCSYISWLGELSCACAPGFQGRRCESKATSALYSAHLPSPLAFRH